MYQAYADPAVFKTTSSEPVASASNISAVSAASCANSRQPKGVCTRSPRERPWYVVSSRAIYIML